MIDVYNHKVIPVDILLYSGLNCKKKKSLEKDLIIILFIRI